MHEYEHFQYVPLNKHVIVKIFPSAIKPKEKVFSTKKKRIWNKNEKGATSLFFHPSEETGPQYYFILMA